MKPIHKKILIGSSIAIAVIAIILLVFLLKVRSQFTEMSPVDSGEIVDSIYAVKDSFVNIYLIKNGENYIAIDGGKNVDTIKSELAKLNISPDKITHLFLTHTDGDHVSAIKLFKNAKVYLSKQEEQMINGTQPRSYGMKNKIDTKQYTLLEDAETVIIDSITIQGILTPGHTLGSMCYLVNDKYLFTGDALSLKNGKVDKFNEFFNMNTNQAFESIKKLMNLPDAKYILTGHHGYTDNYKKAFKHFGKVDKNAGKKGKKYD